MAINKILLIDDTPSQMEAFKKAMPNTGARIITGNSGQDAIDLSLSENPDIIFLDIMMDNVDGYNACREITSNPATKDIPVVFVSSKGQRADQMWAERQGGRALLTKPVNTEQIEEQLKRFG